MVSDPTGPLASAAGHSGGSAHSAAPLLGACRPLVGAGQGWVGRGMGQVWGGLAEPQAWPHLLVFVIALAACSPVPLPWPGAPSPHPAGPGGAGRREMLRESEGERTSLEGGREGTAEAWQPAWARRLGGGRAPRSRRWPCPPPAAAICPPPGGAGCPVWPAVLCGSAPARLCRPAAPTLGTCPAEPSPGPSLGGPHGSPGVPRFCRGESVVLPSRLSRATQRGCECSGSPSKAQLGGGRRVPTSALLPRRCLTASSPISTPYRSTLARSWPSASSDPSPSSPRSVLSSR